MHCNTSMSTFTCTFTLVSLSVVLLRNTDVSRKNWHPKWAMCEMFSHGIVTFQCWYKYVDCIWVNFSQKDVLRIDICMVTFIRSLSFLKRPLLKATKPYFSLVHTMRSTWWGCAIRNLSPHLLGCFRPWRKSLYGAARLSDSKSTGTPQPLIISPLRMSQRALLLRASWLQEEREESRGQRAGWEGAEYIEGKWGERIQGREVIT